MKKVLFALLLAAGIQTSYAQEDTTILKKEIPEESDTIRVGGIIIIKKKGDDGDNEYKVTPENKNNYKRQYKRENITTNWLIFDVGYSGYNDKTDFSNPEAQDFLQFQNGNPATKGDYSLRVGRISNFNLWLFMQRVNIYKHVVNFKYGFGIETNNYFYKNPITYVDGARPFTFRDSISFSRNKIAADFFTVPVMININTNPGAGRWGGFQMSFGVSGGYMYASRQKQVSNERGKQKQRTDFNLNKWKVAYIAELGLGPIRLYGSYSMTTLHNFGLDQYPYNIGVRVNLFQQNYF
ncbi:MAG: hypothetical protein ACRC2O_13940 [Chitinophagaceae bacterium]